MYIFGVSQYHAFMLLWYEAAYILAKTQDVLQETLCAPHQKKRKKETKKDKKRTTTQG